MLLNKMLENIPCRLSADIPQIEIKGITPDPTLCKEGYLFVCIKGFTRDGHLVIDKAIENGAVAFAIDENRPEIEEKLNALSLPYAIFENTRAGEAYLTSRFYNDPWKDLKITAVTGTNGKTSTVTMLTEIYRAAGVKAATIGTITGKMTTPDPSVLYPLLAQYRDEGYTHVIMEASSHALALGKLEPIEFDCGVFTNLTPEHLDFHKTLDEYAKAKAMLFPRVRRAIINADDSYSSVMINASKNPILCSAKGTAVDFCAKNISDNKSQGIDYDVFTKDLVFRITSPIPGSFTVMNTLEAATAAYTDGVPHRTIMAALSRFTGVKGRMERIALPTNDFSLYIDFAHTPDALENVLRTVRRFMKDEQRLVLLFGCGGDRDRTKRPVMGGIASKMADFVIVTADNSRSENTRDIIGNILEGFDESCPHTVIESRKEAIEYAVKTAQLGDVILLAGKGHEEYEIMPDGTHPFSERNIALEASKQYLKDHGLY